MFQFFPIFLNQFKQKIFKRQSKRSWFHPDFQFAELFKQNVKAMQLFIPAFFWPKLCIFSNRIYREVAKVCQPLFISSFFSPKYERRTLEVLGSWIKQLLISLSLSLFLSLSLSLSLSLFLARFFFTALALLSLYLSIYLSLSLSLSPCNLLFLPHKRSTLSNYNCNLSGRTCVEIRMRD